MLSIIISSFNNKNFQNLSLNIDHTIGNIEFEIINIFNPGIKSLTVAYNEGIRKSKFDYLLFIHDDIYFETENWGRKLIQCFESIPSVGVLGVAGAKYKTKAPSIWWRSGNLDQCNYKQYKDGFLIGDYTALGKDDNSEYSEVVVLDGMFLAFDKRIGVFFDERLDGFHNYDISISILFSLKKKINAVIRTITIRHYSCGNDNLDWVLSTYNFYRLYKKKLPLGEIINVETANLIEQLNYQAFINSCLNHKLYKLSLQCLWDYYKMYWHSIQVYRTTCKIFYNIIVRRNMNSK